MTNDSDEQMAKQALTRAMIIAFIIVLVLFIGNYFIGKSILDKDERSAFGSQFGASAALFSGLAFAGLIYAILLQIQELKLQRLELALTRKEMEDTRVEIEGQKKALELQSETMIKQQFEATFFTLFDRLNEFSKRLQFYRIVPTQIVFYHIGSEINDKIRFHVKTSTESDIANDVWHILTSYYAIHNELANYQNLLFSIFQYIDSSIINNKIFYANFINHTMSGDELRFHYFSTLYDIEVNNKFYFEKFSTFTLLATDSNEVAIEYLKSQFDILASSTK
jgi:Putative phage abortive infection protein